MLLLEINYYYYNHDNYRRKTDVPEGVVLPLGCGPHSGMSSPTAACGSRPRLCLLPQSPTQDLYPCLESTE